MENREQKKKTLLNVFIYVFQEILKLNLCFFALQKKIKNK